MPQKIILENGVETLQINVSVRCKDHPGGRVQLKRRYEGVTLGSPRAQSLERALLQEANQEKAQRETQGKTWEVLLDLYEVHTAPLARSGEWCQSRQTFDEAIRSLRKWTTPWYDEVAARIGSGDVTKLLYRMKEDGCAEATLQKMRADVKKVFEFGFMHEHVRGIRQSPTVGVTIKSRKRMRTEILRDDEIVKLLSYSRQYEPVWYFIWAFAVYTGCRNGELYALKWSDIDFKERMITVQRSYNKKFKEEKCTKTGEWRHVSICEPLWEIVEQLKDRHDHDVARNECNHVGYVLPRPGRWQNGEQASKLRQFCEEIGITPVCFHTLRACFATELLKRGVSVPAVMRAGGWTTIKTMMHYVRLAGVDDKGITDPLDYRSKDPIEANKTLMAAVGDKFNDVHEAVVIPLKARNYPHRWR